MNKLLLMIGAAAMVAATGAFAEPVTLPVSVNGNDIVVSVSAGVLDDTSALYLVWDADDHGTNLADWPAENRIAYSGAVTSAAASYTISKESVPDNVCVRIIATSDVRLIGGYVNVGQGQYIDTGIEGNSAYGIQVKFRATGCSAGWGTVMASAQDDFTIGLANQILYKFYLRYQNVEVKDTSTYAIDFTDNAMARSLRIFGKKVYVDGVEAGSYKNTAPNGALAKYTPARTILLGNDWGKTSPYSTPSYRQCYADWHYAAILDANGNELCNLVPALRGNASSPEAVLFDTVRGTCVANSGTGALAYSGDITNTVAVVSAASAWYRNGRVATWVGLGDTSDATDPQNWSVTDMDAPVAGAVPGPGTWIANCTLTADADWSALAATDTWVQVVEHVDVTKGVYVNTEFCPDSNTRVVMDVTVNNRWFSNQYPSVPFPFRLFAVYTNSYNNGAFCLGNDGGGLFSSFGNSGGTVNDTSKWIPLGRHVVDYDKGVVKVDGTVTYTCSGTFTLDRALYLFLTNNKGTADSTNAGELRFHSCRIYDNGTLVRDYVPVNVGGLVKLYERIGKALVEFSKVNGTETVSAGQSTGERLGGDAVEIAGRIDLAGHKLTIADAYGAGEITDSVGGGELHISVGEGLTVRNDGIALKGGFKLVKKGAGLLVGAKAGQTYTGGTEVIGGWARSEVGDRPWGVAKSLVTVVDGAGFDWAGVASTTSTAYSFDIAGEGPDGSGALVNSVVNDGWDLNCLADLTLSDDALISCYGFWGFSYNGDNTTWHVLTMNGHSLNIKMHGVVSNNKDVFAMRHVKTVGEGTVAFVDSDGSWCYPSFFGQAGYPCDLSSVTFDLGAGYKINTEVSPIVGTFIDRRGSEIGAIRPSSALTVLECFKPMATNLVRTVALGDATHLSPVLDLSGINAPFVLPSLGYSMSAANGAKVRVRLGGRSESANTPIITWIGSKPSWVDSIRFVKESDGRRLVVKDDGVYAYSRGLIISFQ